MGLPQIEENVSKQETGNFLTVLSEDASNSGQCPASLPDQLDASSHE